VNEEQAKNVVSSILRAISNSLTEFPDDGTIGAPFYIYSINGKIYPIKSILDSTN
jgi:hypothetical protein